MASLEVRGISQRLDGRLILDDVSFEASSGEILSVIGPSGGGKTTLFRTILGEVFPDKGSVHIDGQDVTRVPPERRGVGVVYQNYAIFPHLTVAENVAYGLRVRRAKRAAIEARVADMLALVKLEEKADLFPARLSGGERQRVALARGLAVEPRVLLLDEAFAALDATTRSDVVQEVRSIVRRLDLTTLLITHDQEEAFLFSQRVLVLNDGKVVTLGAPERVMKHPHPFVQAFVKMVLFEQSKVEQDARGRQFITTEAGAQIPLHIPGLTAGDLVHVMVKKGPETESIEVWPYYEPRSPRGASRATRDEGRDASKR
ncbi:MAG: ABC transporter ATP-binding protein [Thermoplasmatota archaeon]